MVEDVSAGRVEGMGSDAMQSVRQADTVARLG